MICVAAWGNVRLEDVTGTSHSQQSEPPKAPGADLRRARWGTSMAFLLTGSTFATWAARIPALKARLGLTDSQLAIALVGLNAGAVAGLQLGSVLASRFGSRRTLVVFLPAFAAALLPIALAPNLAVLTVALAVSAGTNSVVDIAINDQGVGIQHGYGRSLLTGMHAMHSLGGVLGGAIATAAAFVGLRVVIHFALVAAAAATVAWLTNRTLLPPEQLHGDQVNKARSTPDDDRLDPSVADLRRRRVPIQSR
jgi:MFS family permease